jgi:hypothetical protein
MCLAAFAIEPIELSVNGDITKALLEPSTPR